MSTQTTQLVQNEDGTFTRVTTVVSTITKSYPKTPTTWADLESFVDVMGFSDDEYFKTGFEVDSASPIYIEDTWHIAVYAVTGGSEGYYVHVDQLNRTLDGKLKAAHMLGKFWSSERAMEAVNAVTKYIQGWK